MTLSADAPDLRPAGTLVAAAVLVAALGLFLWLELNTSKIARVDEPERALSLMVGKTLDLEEGLARLPAWERFLYEGVAGSGLSELEQSIVWYEELHEQSAEPRAAFELAILYGEAGRLDAVGTMVEGWKLEAAPYGIYAAALAAAYLQVEDAAPAPRWEQQVESVLPSGWFQDRLLYRLAERAGDRSHAAARQAALDARGMALVSRVRDLTLIELIALGVGLPAFVVVWRRGQLAVGGATLPPPWKGWTGMAVFMRGAAAGIVITNLFMLLEGNSLVVRLIVMPLAAVPLLVLTREYLLRPAGQGLLSGFGLRPMAGAIAPLVIAVAAVLGAGLLIEWGLGMVADSQQLSGHWTEWFDSDLAWGDGPRLVVTMLEYMVFAPVVEELTFRGVLYSTLRRRFTLWPAAVLTATLFAAVHGYGLIGFLSVLTSGLLWCWIYEKTGSLLPGIVAHALNNLFVCITVMWLLR